MQTSRRGGNPLVVAAWTFAVAQFAVAAWIYVALTFPYEVQKGIDVVEILPPKPVWFDSALHAAQLIWLCAWVLGATSVVLLMLRNWRAEVSDHRPSLLLLSFYTVMFPPIAMMGLMTRGEEQAKFERRYLNPLVNASVLLFIVAQVAQSSLIPVYGFFTFLYMGSLGVTLGILTLRLMKGGLALILGVLDLLVALAALWVAVGRL
jgi:hypothetical protein